MAAEEALQRGENKETTSSILRDSLLLYPTTFFYIVGRAKAMTSTLPPEAARAPVGWS